MDSVNSFKGYGKVDPVEEEAFHHERRKRWIIVIVASILLVIGAVVGIGTVVHKRSSKFSSSSNSVPAPEVTPATSLRAVCSETLFPDLCYSSISSVETSNTTNPEVLFKLSLRGAMDELSKLKAYPAQLKAKTNDTRLVDALHVCESVFDDAKGRHNDNSLKSEMTIKP